MVRGQHPLPPPADAHHVETLALEDDLLHWLLSAVAGLLQPLAHFHPPDVLSAIGCRPQVCFDAINQILDVSEPSGIGRTIGDGILEIVSRNAEKVACPKNDRKRCSRSLPSVQVSTAAILTNLGTAGI
jgi:hypothetical protein